MTWLFLPIGPLILWFMRVDYRWGKRKGIPTHWSNRERNPFGFILACALYLGMFGAWAVSFTLMLLGH